MMHHVVFYTCVHQNKFGEIIDDMRMLNQETKKWSSWDSNWGGAGVGGASLIWEFSRCFGDHSVGMNWRKTGTQCQLIYPYLMNTH